MDNAIHIEANRTKPCAMYISDVEYVRRKPPIFGQVPLKLQILTPNPIFDKGKHPLVMFINGGGFFHPQMYWRVPWLTRLAERGYVVVMPEYRGSERNTFPAPIEDVRTATRYMLTHADDYGADADKLIIMGGSAGGYTSLMAAYTGDKFSAADDDLSVKINYDGVIDLYGPTDMLKMINPKLSETEARLSPEGRLVGMKDLRCEPEIVKEISVTSYISKDAQLPPTLIAHGDVDSVVTYSQSEILYKALTEAGKQVEMYCVDGAEHADTALFSESMMDVYDAFIKKVLSAKK